jgi:hypothetical protein
MWRLKTHDGEQVNVFGEESSNSNWHLLTPAWQAYLESVTVPAYRSEAIEVIVSTDGPWNKLESIETINPPPIISETRRPSEILESAMSKLDEAQQPAGSLASLKNRLGTLDDGPPPIDEAAAVAPEESVGAHD